MDNSVVRDWSDGAGDAGGGVAVTCDGVGGRAHIDAYEARHS